MLLLALTFPNISLLEKLKHPAKHEEITQFHIGSHHIVGKQMNELSVLTVFNAYSVLTMFMISNIFIIASFFLIISICLFLKSALV